MNELHRAQSELARRYFRPVLESVWRWDPIGIAEANGGTRVSDYDEIARSLAFGLADGLSVDQLAARLRVDFRNDWGTNLRDTDVREFFDSLMRENLDQDQ